MSARDRHDAVLQRLAQDLQRVLAELWQFVEEEDAAMRQRDLTGTRPASSAHETGVAGICQDTGCF